MYYLEERAARRKAAIRAARTIVITAAIFGLVVFGVFYAVSQVDGSAGPTAEIGSVQVVEQPPPEDSPGDPIGGVDNVRRGCGPGGQGAGTEDYVLLGPLALGLVWLNRRKHS